MNQLPLEGTIRFEGMIEGRMPPSSDTEQKLQEWIRFARDAGLHLVLEIDGGHFSMLADDKAYPVDPPQIDPSSTICSTLNELKKAFEPGPPPQFFSTLRSREYRKNEEVQTLYQVDASGQRFETEQRTVKATTAAPEAPMTFKEQVRRVLIGAVVALAILGGLSFFVDFGALWSRMIVAVSPIDPETIVVDAHAFEDYFTVKKVEPTTAAGRPAIVLTLERDERFPATAAAREQAWQNSPDSLEARMILFALARGRCDYDIYDSDEKLIAHSTLRFDGLSQEKTLRVVLPLPHRTRPARIVLQP